MGGCMVIVTCAVGDVWACGGLAESACRYGVHVERERLLLLPRRFEGQPSLS